MDRRLFRTSKTALTVQRNQIGKSSANIHANQIGLHVSLLFLEQKRNSLPAATKAAHDPLFDLGTIIGKVFDDQNANNIQDEGERGVAGAMVVLDDGTYVLTDAYGRYHFPAVHPGQRLVKINIDSLPSGSALSLGRATEVVSITPGLLAKANFAVSAPRRTERMGRAGETATPILPSVPSGRPSLPLISVQVVPRSVLLSK